MTTWITDSEKNRLLELITGQFEGGTASTIDLANAKMGLQTLEVQAQAAKAEERSAIAGEMAAKASVKNARYMLWSVIAAAVSAIASLASIIVPIVAHH